MAEATMLLGLFVFRSHHRDLFLLAVFGASAVHPHLRVTILSAGRTRSTPRIELRSGASTHLNVRTTVRKETESTHHYPSLLEDPFDSSYSEATVRGSMVYVRIVAALVGLLLSIGARAADPGVGEWTTIGNGPTHTGFYPKTIGSAPFLADWTKTFPTQVNQVAVSGDTIYATTNGYFSSGMRAFALSVADGSQKWSFPLADAYSVNPPTYAQGRVYFQRGNHSGDTHLWCLDASSGRLIFAAPHSAQWERYAAPTIADGGAFLNGGGYGGMYGFDATTGAQRFFNSDLGQVSGWTPSYWNGAVYTCVNGNFTAHNPQTGAQLWTRNLKDSAPGGTWHAGSIPVISDGKAAVVAEGRIAVIDLATRTQLWTKSGSYLGTPAFAEGVVYAFVGTEVKAYAAADGALLGTYTAPAPNGSTCSRWSQGSAAFLQSSTNLVFDRASSPCGRPFPPAEH
jgi:outer membrane protein assembly factor BamB